MLPQTPKPKSPPVVNPPSSLVPLRVLVLDSVCCFLGTRHEHLLMLVSNSKWKLKAAESKFSCPLRLPSQWVLPSMAVRDLYSFGCLKLYSLLISCFSCRFHFHRYRQGWPKYPSVSSFFSMSVHEFLTVFRSQSWSRSHGHGS